MTERVEAKPPTPAELLHARAGQLYTHLAAIRYHVIEAHDLNELLEPQDRDKLDAVAHTVGVFIRQLSDRLDKQRQTQGG